MSNFFSFLIATDCHLGYEETDHIIGEDSFITFEEILIKAVEEDVDMILLGGDLFHHNNPSPKCMNKCMSLLRQYTLGDRPVYFELLCNASEVLSNSISQTTNYLDDNINVSIPVFSIHGNHDDPSGHGHFSALDTLSSAGLVNYFGKWTNLDEVVIKPILMRKGTTRIALYGLSHIKDDRLCRLFLNQRVKFIRPENEPDEWFNIFVLHQNRADRGPKRFVSESYIPDFMDLVIWGHEHDCEIEPVLNIQKGFYIVQPGSSVATSLSQGESYPKFVANLQIYQKKMKLKPLKLNTVRPFIFRIERLWEVVVTTEDREQKSEEIKVHCQQIVEEMIRESETRLTGHIRQPKLPLIRLRCDYDDESQLFNTVKFGQMFQGRVANPHVEIVRLKRLVGGRVKKEKSEDLARLNELYKDNMEEAYNFTACVNHIIKDYFTNHKESKMLILRLPQMAAAMEKFIDKDDISAIEELVDHRFERMFKDLREDKVNVDETNLTELFERMRDEDEKMNVKEEVNLEKKLQALKPSRSEDSGSGSRIDMKNDENGMIQGDNDEDDFNKVNTGRNVVICNSDTDEYDVDAAKDHKSGIKNKSSSDDSDGEMFGRTKGRGNRKSPRDENVGRGKETIKTRGRGGRRGRGSGRGRASNGNRKESLPVAQVRTSSKCGNTFAYSDDDDSDD